jgi:hypothetical protein
MNWAVTSTPPDKDGVTPVKLAATEGCEKVVKLLRKLGAVMKGQTANGYTAIDARCGGRETVQVHLAVRVLPKESRCGCQAVCLQPMQEDVLLLYGLPETGLEAAQADVFCCCRGRPGLTIR